MGVFTVISPDIIQCTEAGSSSLTALTSVASVAPRKLFIKPLTSRVQKQMTWTSNKFLFFNDDFSQR